jgi:vancomycin resistance protein YoaR
VRLFFVTFLVSMCLFSASVRAQDAVIAEYSTVYAWRGDDFRDRAHNIELAASKLNGLVLNTGDSFSFNGVVGPRTEQRGFREAHVIIAGDLVDGLGGGVCQVASTLHATVLLAGLVVTEEHSHSRTSAYIEPTLDATVSWASRDFKFVNSFGFPIRVQVVVDDDPTPKSKKRRLTVRILGRNDPYDVTIDTEVLKTRKFKTRYMLDPQLPPGRRKRREPGTLGLDVIRTRTIRNRSGELVSTEVVKYHYEPSDRIWDVGPKKD